MDTGTPVEAIFRDYFTSLPTPVCVVNSDRKIFFTNKAFDNIFTKNVKYLESLYKWSNEFIPGFCENTPFYNLQQRFFTSGKDSFREKFFIRAFDKDGAVRHYELVAQAERDTLLLVFEEFHNLFLTDKDFTRIILEEMDDAVIACDHDGVLVLFNEKAREWHGMDALPIKSPEWGSTYSLFEGDGVTPLPSEKIPLLLAYHGQKITDIPITIKTPDTPVRYVLASGGPIYNQQKNKIGAVVVMRDITDQKKLIREVAERERAYRNLVETVPDVVIETDLKGNISFVNDVLVSKNYIPDKRILLGRNIIDFVAPLYKAEASEKLLNFVKENPGKMEYVVIFPGNRRVDCDVKGNLLVDNEGAPRGIVFVLRDLTKVKQNETQLRMLAHTVMSISEGVSITDTSNKIVFVNEAFEKIYGYSKEELIGARMEVVRSPDNDPDVVDSILYQTLNGGWEGEIVNRRKDGTDFPVYLSTSTVRGDKGEVLYLVGICKDITRAKKAEEEQRKAEELRLAHEAAQVLIKAQRHLSLLIDQTLVGFIETTTDLVVKAWNPSAERIFGFSSSEMIGKRLPDTIVPPGQKGRVKQNLEKIMSTRGGYRTIHNNIRKDGSEIICEWHSTALVDTDGQILNISSLVADITKRIEAEKELSESREKLQQFANHLQNAIEQERVQISRDLHDSLGQSLTGLKIFCSRLSKKLKDNPGNEKLVEMSEEMIALIESIMQRTREIARKLRPEVLDQVGLIAAIESLLQEVLGNAGIEYSLNKKINDIPVKNKNRIEVFRIVQEILTNILKHSKATFVSIDIYAAGEETILKISDNGVGIREVNILKLKTLGLMGMNERAASFGGVIEIRGVEKEGTTITLKIPHV